jgi:S-adenosylmethionine hydrolase
MSEELPAPSGVITLLTDFGLSDPFVGVLTGVLLSRFPGARVVDLCHGIRPQAIAEAAFWLERCYCWFPGGTVHVAVVDPGVGSARAVLAAAIAGHYFLVPDNGLLATRLLEAPDARVLAVHLAQLGLPAPSATFHGRDVFAPLAAGLASGERRFATLGVPTRALPCCLPVAQRTATGASGEVVCVDRFGNLITNLEADPAQRRGATQVRVGGQSLRWLRTYADAAPGELLALVNAFGVLEIAQRDGSAERQLGVTRGAQVELVDA